MFFTMAEIIRNIIDIAKLTSKLLSALRLVINTQGLLYIYICHKVKVTSLFS